MSNAACMGYVQLTLEHLDVPAEKIAEVMLELCFTLDVTTESEAEKHYRNGAY